MDLLRQARSAALSRWAYPNDLTFKRGAPVGCTQDSLAAAPLAAASSVQPNSENYTHAVNLGKTFLPVLFVFCNKTRPPYQNRTVVRSPGGLRRRKARRGAYNLGVARGWESKSVEEQQFEAAEKATRTGPPPTRQDAMRWRKSENLRLARQRVLQQLAANPSSRYRKLLEAALADLDEKLNR